MAFAAIVTAAFGFRAVPMAAIVAARHTPRKTAVMVGVDDLKSDLLAVLATVPVRGTTNWQAAYDARPPPYVQQVLASP